MNSEQKNLAYWFGLTLWPLDAACRYVCGADPNNPDQSPLSLPDPATRPEWANLFHHATADVEVEIFEGKGGARGVDPAEFLAWARSKGCGLDAKFDVLLANKPAAKVEARLPVATQQNNAILNWLKSDRYDPLKLPVPQSGKAGVKKLCRDALCNSSKQLFLSPNVFNTAWERLRANSEIIDAQ